MIIHADRSITKTNFIDCRWDCQICDKSYPSRKQMIRHHQDVHGDIIRCNTCSYDLPSSRKYLMTRHFDQRHPGTKVCYAIHSRKEKRSSTSPTLLYKPRKISRYPSPKAKQHSTKQLSTRKQSCKEMGQTTRNSNCTNDISPLRSPSLSISLHGSPSLVNLYGLDDEPVTFEPPRKVVRSSPTVSDLPPVKSHAFSSATTCVPAVSVVVPPASTSVSSVRNEVAVPSETAGVPQENVAFPVASVFAPFDESAMNLVSASSSTVMSPTSSFIASLGADFPLVSPLKDSVLSGSSAPLATSGSTSVETCPPATDYVLHSCQGSDLSKSSLDLSKDPRLFFAGAPSGIENTFVANMLRRANKEARRSAGRSVTCTWIPSSSCYVTKMEELRFSDGRTYRLTSTICPDPHYRVTMESATLTEESGNHLPSLKRDVSTQVTTKQTITLE